MISSIDFKKLVTKYLKPKLKILGFKGSGFQYKMEDNEFIYCIGIQASQYGGQCCVELGIQPKILCKNKTNPINEEKIKYYDCELRTRLSPKSGFNKWWKYSDNENNNIKTIDEIFETINSKALPIIKLFKTNNKILESIDVSDLDHISKHVSPKLGGFELMTTEIRLSWALSKIFENTNLKKAKEFAKYGFSKSGTESTFIGNHDFIEILNK